MNQVERENNSLWKIREVLIEEGLDGWDLRDEYDHSQQNVDYGAIVTLEMHYN